MRTFRFYNIILTVCCVMLLTACIAEDPSSIGGYQDGENSMLLELNVNSRTVDANGNVLTEIEPEGYEKQLYSLRIYAYTNGELVGHHYIPNVAKDAVIPYSFLMDVTAKTTAVQPIDFYVIANEAGLGGLSASLTAEMKESVLNNMTFASLNLPSNISEMKMPNILKMRYWIDMSDEASKLAEADKYPDHAGHTIAARVYKSDANGNKGDELTDSEGNPTANIPFNLERPTSKLRIFAASLDETADMTIVSAVLKGGTSPASAWLIPHSDRELQDRTYQTINEVQFNLTAESKTKCKYFDPNNKDNNSERLDDANYTEITGRAYYPHEIPFGSDVKKWNEPTYYNAAGNVVTDGSGTVKGNVLEIKYSFDGGVTTRTGTVYLPPLKRNHYYAVYCLMNNSGRFTIEYAVADWDHADNGTNDWTLDYSYPSYSPLFPISATSLEDALKKNLFVNPQCWPVAYDSADPFKGCFTAKFVITAPNDVEVTPSVDHTGIDVEIWQGGNKITNSDGTNATHMGCCSKDNPYTIVLRPNSDAVAGKFNLMISWKPTWNNATTHLLLINQGSGDSRLWPDSGLETDMIEVECLTQAP